MSAETTYGLIFFSFATIPPFLFFFPKKIHFRKGIGGEAYAKLLRINHSQSLPERDGSDERKH
jgi:hypothetical protein